MPMTDETRRIARWLGAKARNEILTANSFEAKRPENIQPFEPVRFDDLSKEEQAIYLAKQNKGQYHLPL